MTIKIIDAAFETTTTTGSGSYTLAGAQPGHQSFAVAGTGSKVLYQVNDGSASGVITQREVGIGTITISGGVTTLSRDTILYSTNSNAAINWTGSNPKNVIGSIAAAALPTRDEKLNFVEGFGPIAGTANALTLTLPVAPLDYSDGMQIAGFLIATNTTAGATIAVNGLSVKALKYNGADPGIGKLPIEKLLVARYSAAKGWFELISPITLSNASTTIPGVVQLATDAELKTGTDAQKALTPSNVKNALGFSNFFESAEIAYVASAGGYSAAHGLGAVPKLMKTVLRCKMAESGFTVGDELNCDFGDNSGTFQIMTGSNATTCFAGQNGPLRFENKAGSGIVTLTAANWRVVFKAWA